MRGNGTIRARLAAMVAIPLVALLVFGAAAGVIYSQTRVGGPADERIDAAQDLVADVLPPPLYIVEAYATVLQVTSKANAGQQDELLSRLQRLETEFRQRTAVWQRDLVDRGLRQSLLEDSYAPAAEFFSVVDDQLVPLVRAEEYADAQALANGRLATLYERHRAAVDDVVQQARASQRILEAEAYASARRQAAIAGTTLVVLLGLTLLLGSRIARSISRPVRELQRVALTDLPAVVEQVRDAGFDDGKVPQVEPVPVSTSDEFADVATAFNAVVQAAVELAGEQARLRQNTADTFVNLGRRNQNLVSRQLRAIDAMQISETDPERLQRLFHLDHMATRMRRNAESLLVLAGLEAPRKWKRPVSIADVARASLAEVEQYERVALSVVQSAMLPGYMVADMTHILAELVENALRSSPPDSTVTVTGGFLPDCYQIAVIDQGMGLAPRDLEAANARLAAAEGFSEAPTAHLGLFVVARLARRHDVAVELESDGGYGSTAYVTVPLAAIEQAELPDDRAVQAQRPQRVVVSLPSARTADAHDVPALPTATLSVVSAPAQPQRDDPPFETWPARDDVSDQVWWNGVDAADEPLRPAAALAPGVPGSWDEQVVTEEHGPGGAGVDAGLGDSGFTRTGLPKRSSRLGRRGPPPFSSAVPVATRESEAGPRLPDQVQALYDGFASGRRRARDEQ